MSFTMLIILGIVAYFAIRRAMHKKRQRDIRNWSVDFRNEDIRPVTRRLRWKDFS